MTKKKSLRLITFIIFVFSAVSCKKEMVPQNLSDAKTMEWLKSRTPKIDANEPLTFSDILDETGIIFKNQSSPDTGVSFKGNHYDHGNGLAVADVDGDGLSDIYFVSQIGGNKLYKNQGNGRFSDITEEAGVGLKNKVNISASFADLNNDGSPDLYVTTIKDGNVLFMNRGDGTFDDVSKTSGVDYVGHSSSSTIFDFNNDGLLDILVNNVGVFTSDKRGDYNYCIGLDVAFGNHLFDKYTETSVLYKNVGKSKFQKMDVKDFSTQSWSGDSIVLDVNNDGHQDLYILRMQGHDQLLINNKGKGFTDKTDEYFAGTPWGSMGGVVLDSRNSGKSELYITDMHSDMFKILKYDEVKLEGEKSLINPKLEVLKDPNKNIFGNAYYTFDRPLATDISLSNNTENYWPWGVSADDFNADSFTDLFITSGMSVDHKYAMNSLLINDQKGSFVNRTFQGQIEPRKNQMTHQKWFVLDCDKWDQLNLICLACFNKQADKASDTVKTQMANYDKSLCEDLKRVAKKEEGKTILYETMSSRSSVSFDYDNDGDLDIITNEFNGVPLFLRNNLASKKEISYLKVKLIGRKSNRDGLGAVVSLNLDDGLIRKWNNGKSGYLAQSSLPLYFGLTGRQVPRSITISWPSGKVQTKLLSNQKNTLVVINEEN